MSEEIGLVLLHGSFDYLPKRQEALECSLTTSEEGSESLELESQAIALIWVLGTELWPSGGISKHS